MKILITGSAGFLGQHFYQALKGRGHELFGVDLLPDNTSGAVEDVVAYLGRHLLEAREPFDQVFHFAAPVGGRVKIEGDPLFNADSLRIDSALFRYAAKFPGITVVYPSSSAVYGAALQGRDATALRESAFHPADPRWFAPDEMYGFTKMAGEVLAWKSAQYGVNSLCIRPFSGYGEGQPFDYPTPSIAARALKREDPLTIWGSGAQMRDFIHVDDLVRLTLARLELGVSGYDALNLGSGVSTSFRRIAEMFADLIGYKPVIQSDTSKPVGVFRRFADTTRMRQYEFERPIPLRVGLGRVLVDVEQRLGVAV